jgi:hypothetical protein
MRTSVCTTALSPPILCHTLGNAVVAAFLVTEFVLLGDLATAHDKALVR